MVHTTVAILELEENITYRNKNSFRAAESIELKLRARIESIPDFVDTTDQGANGLSLNTWEVGPEITLRIPRFLWPLNGYNHSSYADPITLLTTSYNYQKRPEYKRNQLVLSSGFEFRETRFKRHFVYPAEINHSDFTLTEAFIKKLIDINDPQLIIYYRDYLITNGRYSFLYNTQQQNIYKDFIFFRFTFEIAGNSIRLIDLITKKDYDKQKQYQLAGNRYSQYVRPDFDLRYYQVFSSNSSLVYRLSSGIGIAYLNSQFMPYEKHFLQEVLMIYVHSEPEPLVRALSRQIIL
ncbi:MAG: hypothetical protein IPP71_13790 [Bacteroidetes bacterium]|nr:hypothetical protein [Bacteroidota bacterium]